MDLKGSSGALKRITKSSVKKTDQIKNAVEHIGAALVFSDSSIKAIQNVLKGIKGLQIKLIPPSTLPVPVLEVNNNPSIRVSIASLEKLQMPEFRALMKSFAPSAVVISGTGFGMNTQEQKVRDILIAKEVLKYIIQPSVLRGKRHLVLNIQDKSLTTSGQLYNMFSKAGEYIDFRKASHTGIILMGVDLPQDFDFREQLRRITPSPIGVAHIDFKLIEYLVDYEIPWILVKAVAGWPDGRATDSIQKELALQKSLGFVIDVVHNYLAEQAE